MPGEKVTKVAFRFGAPDKVAYTCRLLRKAISAGSNVLVTADEADLQRLDADLWAVSPTDFLSHAAHRDSAFTQELSQVVLATSVGQTRIHRSVLVNLAGTVQQRFEQFARVIEVVGADETDRSIARARWKQYAQLGYAIARHDLSSKW
jgi:DNA polymerase III subunit chi